MRPTRADVPGRKRPHASGSTSRAAAGALRIGNTFGAVLTAKRPVGPAEAVMLLYGAGRAVLEVWRGDVHRGVFFGGAVSTSQLISFAAILLALLMLARGLRERRAVDAPAS